jgi:hypothetical protein
MSVAGLAMLLLGISLLIVNDVWRVWNILGVYFVILAFWGSLLFFQGLKFRKNEKNKAEKQNT